MKVEILESGTQAKEVNPLGERQKFIDSAKWNKAYRAEIQWQQAESMIKVYEIDSILNVKWLPGMIKDAELLPNGKIKLI